MFYLALFCLNIFQLSPRYPSAEVEIVNAEMLDPACKVVFRGYHNNLKVNGLESNTNFTLTTSRDTLQKIGFNDFGYVASRQSTDTIRVVLNGRIIHEEVFQIRNMPRPEVKFGDITENQTVSLSYILSNPGIFVYLPGYPFNLSLNVIGYDAKILYKNGNEIALSHQSPIGFNDWSERKIKRYLRGKFVFHKTETDSEILGNRFYQEQLNLIKKMEVGDQLVFGYGTFSCPSCKQSRRNINLTLTVGSK